MLMTLYSTGMRRAELVRLKVSDIDSQRMIVHIRQGKGDKDRDVPLSRCFWRRCANTGGGGSPDLSVPERAPLSEEGEPISTKAVWHACRMLRSGPASRRMLALIRFATVCHPPTGSGGGSAHVQVLLGHADIRHTRFICICPSVTCAPSEPAGRASRFRSLHCKPLTEERKNEPATHGGGRYHSCGR